MSASQASHPERTRPTIDASAFGGGGRGLDVRAEQGTQAPRNARDELVDAVAQQAAAKEDEQDRREVEEPPDVELEPDAEDRVCEDDPGAEAKGRAQDRQRGLLHEERREEEDRLEALAEDEDGRYG